MTPREQLVQEVLQAPDFLVSALLKLLRLVRGGQMGVAQRITQFAESIEPEQIGEEALTEQQKPILIRKGSAWVISGELPAGFDVNELISDVREERIFQQMGL